MCVVDLTSDGDPSLTADAGGECEVSERSSGRSPSIRWRYGHTSPVVIHQVTIEWVWLGVSRDVFARSTELTPHMCEWRSSGSVDAL